MLTLKNPIATLHRDEKNIQDPKATQSKTKKKSTKKVTKKKATKAKTKVAKKITGKTMSIFK